MELQSLHAFDVINRWYLNVWNISGMADAPEGGVRHTMVWHCASVSVHKLDQVASSSSLDSSLDSLPCVSLVVMAVKS